MNRRQAVALRRITRIAPPDRRLALATLACGALAVLAAIALLTTSGALIAKAALRPPVLSLSVLIVSVRAFGLLRASARYGERLASHDLALRALTRLRTTLFARLVGVAPNGRRAGELLARFVADVDTLQNLYLRGLAPPAIALVTALVTAGAAALILPAAGAVVLAGLVTAGVLVPLATAAVAHRAGRRQAAARADLLQQVLDAARHAPELAVLGCGPQRLEQAAAADGRLHRLAVRDALAGSLAGGLGTLVQGAAVIGTVLVAAPAVHHGDLSAILLPALAFLTLASFEAVAPLPLAAQQVAATAAAAERVGEVLDRTPTVVDPRHPAELPTAALALEGVALHHPDVLFDADLVVAPGERVALVGPSGIGKTTLAGLLIRFRDPDAGRVTLGGVDVRRLRQADLRRAVRLIAQDAAIFTTTIAENVRLARPDATDAEVLGALRAAGLGPWIDGLPDHERTLVGEDGAEVSGGQRRRIDVARALLADAAFLIVDEPTAHLDPASAAALQRALGAHARARGQGLLAIVHGEPDPAVFDRVLELRGGRLVER